MSAELQTVKAKISGETLNVNIVGGSVTIPGTVNANISGQQLYLPNDGINNVVKISGQTINIQGGVNISGQKIYLQNDGINNVTKISGEQIRLPNDSINNVVKISGEKIGGWPNDGINNVTKISGEAMSLAAQTIVTAAMVAPIGTSGGTQLPNQACKSVTIRSVSGNNVMFIGGVGAHAPFSGKGLELYGGEAKTFFVTNFNLLSIFAVSGGQNVSLIGEQ